MNLIDDPSRIWLIHRRWLKLSAFVHGRWSSSTWMEPARDISTMGRCVGASVRFIYAVDVLESQMEFARLKGRWLIRNFWGFEVAPWCCCDVEMRTNCWRCDGEKNVFHDRPAEWQRCKRLAIELSHFFLFSSPSLCLSLAFPYRLFHKCNSDQHIVKIHMYAHYPHVRTHVITPFILIKYLNACMTFVMQLLIY